MQGSRREHPQLLPLWLLACCCVFAASAARADDVTAVAAACPGFAAWEQQQAAADLAVEQSGSVGTDWRLRAQLLGMAVEDQDAREAAFASPGHQDTGALDRVAAVDARNLSALQEIIAVGGIPSAQSVGRRGVSALWVLVQHADADAQLQQQVLKALTGDPGIAQDQIAALTDRLRIHQGQPQRYGTQFRTSGDTLVPDSIEDEAHVDGRRRQMGLPPLADYTCALRATYKLAPAGAQVGPPAGNGLRPATPLPGK